MAFFSKFRRNGQRESVVEYTSSGLDRPTITTGSKTWGTTGSTTWGSKGSKTWGTTVSRVPSWPEGAKPLKKHTWLTWLYMVGDVVLVLLPIYFVRKSPYLLVMINGVTTMHHYSMPPTARPIS
jgi:hypothetical protein